jgi:hypothetical protein
MYHKKINWTNELRPKDQQRQRVLELAVQQAEQQPETGVLETAAPVEEVSFLFKKIKIPQGIIFW